MKGKPQKTKVVIAGITIKDDDSDINYLLEWSRTETLSGDTIKNFVIVCPRSVENVLTISDDNLIGNDKEVIITRGVDTSTDEIIFRGLVQSYFILGSKITFNCVDRLYIATKKKINYTYDKDIDPSSGKISEIFKDMINVYCGGELVADDDSVQDSGDILIRDKVICKSDTVFSRLESELANPIDWNVYYNPITDKVNFEPKGFTNNSTTIQSEVNLLNSPKWESREDGLFNYIEVQGAEQEIQTIESGQIGITSGYNQESVQLGNIPNIVRVLCDSNNPPTTEKVGGVISSTASFDYSVDNTKKQIIWNTSEFEPSPNDYVLIEYTFNRPTPIVVSDPTSIAKFGKKDLTVLKSDLTSVSDARLYANTLLSEYKEPVMYSTLRVTDVKDLRAGQRIRVKDSANNIDDYFYITHLKQSYPYSYDEVQVVSNVLNIDDGFFIFVINKLKQLDRSSKDDFSSLIEVVSLSNEMIYENRFIKITKTILDGAGGIYGHPKSIYGESTYWEEPVYPFILGHPVYGVLGQSRLGKGNIDIREIYLGNVEQTYIELFYDEYFKDAGSGVWNITDEQLELNDANMFSKPFVFDLENETDNCYKSLSVSIVGSGLDNLQLFITEHSGSDKTSEVMLIGSDSSKSGSIKLTNSNKRGLSWSMSSSNSIIKQLIIRYS